MRRRAFDSLIANTHRGLWYYIISSSGRLGYVITLPQMLFFVRKIAHDFLEPKATHYSKEDSYIMHSRIGRSPTVTAGKRTAVFMFSIDFIQDYEMKQSSTSCRIFSCIRVMGQESECWTMHDRFMHFRSKSLIK